ncbi:MAG: hypothetical protein KGY45_02380 [Hadesarchaea archaeon]|nr:hypothetical protein [Hadesarchaea archaeon]
MTDLESKRDEIIEKIERLEREHETGEITDLDYRIVRKRLEEKLRKIRKKLGEVPEEEIEEVKEKEKEEEGKESEDEVSELKKHEKREVRFKSFAPLWLFVLGTMGGLLTIISLGLPWLSGSAEGITKSVTGWWIGANLSKQAAAGLSFFSPLIMFFGGAIAFMGGIGMCIERGMEFELPLGGFTILISGIWGLSEMPKIAEITSQAVNSSIEFSVSYGVYIGLIGGLLALIGTLGLMLE